jgi:hypothetical protein
MGVTAKALQLGVPIVTAFHVDARRRDPAVDGAVLCSRAPVPRRALPPIDDD